MFSQTICPRLGPHIPVWCDQISLWLICNASLWDSEAFICVQIRVMGPTANTAASQLVRCFLQLWTRVNANSQHRLMQKKTSHHCLSSNTHTLQHALQQFHDPPAAKLHYVTLRHSAIVSDHIAKILVCGWSSLWLSLGDLQRQNSHPRFNHGWLNPSDHMLDVIWTFSTSDAGKQNNNPLAKQSPLQTPVGVFCNYFPIQLAWEGTKFQTFSDAL